MASELLLRRDEVDLDVKRCETRNSLCGSLSTDSKTRDSTQGRFGVSLKPNLPVSSNGGSCGSCNRNERVEEELREA